MESRAIASSLHKLWQDLRDLDEASRPAMDEDERDGVLNITLLMHEMNPQRLKSIDIDISGVLRQLVELGFCLSPVEPVLPMLNEPLHVFQGSTIVPVRLIELVW